MFDLTSEYKPSGDQPVAIKELTDSILKGNREQTLLGVTGSGKTFTMANIIQNINKPTLILSHNKTLAAQLFSEFKEFFPNNAVEYFVSYFDYYQPEAYIPNRDIYIEKDSAINEEIDRLRLSATTSLLSRKDVIIVSSVSCIYGLGSVADFNEMAIEIKVGEMRKRDKLFRQFNDIQYSRHDIGLERSMFRVRGESVDIWPADKETAIRISFFGDKIERISEIHPLTNNVINNFDNIRIFPAKHHVADKDRIRAMMKNIAAEEKLQIAKFEKEGKVVESMRLSSRIKYDLEMIEQTGYTKGIENYSRYLTNREEGEQPATLLDYFPDDNLIMVDESHISLPQVRGMYNGDRARKQVLVDYGFRLPSALDNRPLTYTEFERHNNQTLYVSATPNEYELLRSKVVAKQIIRPTGLLDPIIEVRGSDDQVDDLIKEIKTRIGKSQRVLVTTITKRLAEDLTDYLGDLDFKVAYIHSDIGTMERTDILADLRKGVYDVLVGINLLREGLDLPEVSLVAIIDADKEGFLRSKSSLVQIIGRASRHKDGRVIMYADRITDSMQYAIDQTAERRKLQKKYNKENGITPTTITKSVRDRIVEDTKEELLETYEDINWTEMSKEDTNYTIKQLEEQMNLASSNLQFEVAATIRDQIKQIRNELKD